MRPASHRFNFHFICTKLISQLTSHCPTTGNVPKLWWEYYHFVHERGGEYWLILLCDAKNDNNVDAKCARVAVLKWGLMKSKYSNWMERFFSEWQCTVHILIRVAGEGWLPPQQQQSFFVFPRKIKFNLPASIVLRMHLEHPLFRSQLLLVAKIESKKHENSNKHFGFFQGFYVESEFWLKNKKYADPFVWMFLPIVIVPSSLCHFAKLNASSHATNDNNKNQNKNNNKNENKKKKRQEKRQSSIHIIDDEFIKLIARIHLF